MGNVSRFQVLARRSGDAGKSDLYATRTLESACRTMHVYGLSHFLAYACVVCYFVTFASAGLALEARAGAIVFLEPQEGIPVLTNKFCSFGPKSKKNRLLEGSSRS